MAEGFHGVSFSPEWDKWLARSIEHSEAKSRHQEAVDIGTLLMRQRVDWDDGEDAEVPDIIEDLVADEEVTLLGGHGGIGKSILGMQMACAVATGQPIFGKSTDLTGKGPKKVLYYSAEDPKKRLKRRMRSIAAQFYPVNNDGSPADAHNQALRAMLRDNLLLIDASEFEPLFGELDAKQRSLGAKTDYFTLQHFVAMHAADLVIIDGGSDAFDGNEISRRDVRAFIKLLRKINFTRKLAVLLMVHIDRSSARGNVTGDDGYSGSTAWHNSCRRRLFLQSKKEKDEDGNEMEPALFLRVMKNQDAKPIDDFELEQNNVGLWFQIGSVPQDVQFGGKLAKEELEADHSLTLLGLIEEYYQREHWISTSLAPQATKGVYATLKGDPRFPKGLTRKKTEAIVRDLQRNGLLTDETYRRAQGGTDARWKVVR